jgi:coenzyme Q-binding protein COQ10
MYFQYFDVILNFTIFRYTMEQMYDIVAEVDKYNKFVPWCTQSTITNATPEKIDCKLQIGFPPVVERYTSVVTLKKPSLVHVSN